MTQQCHGGKRFDLLIIQSRIAVMLAVELVNCPQRIKLMTKQFVPISGTVIHNAMNSTMSVFRL